MTSGRLPDGTTAALLVVPQGTSRADALAAAIRARHPQWHVTAVWCGDPQLQPARGVAWCDAPIDELALVATDAHAWEWRRAIAAATELLDAGASSVVLLWVGSVAVTGSLDPLVGVAPAPLVLVPRVLGPMPDDECTPTEADLVAAGPFSTTVAVVGRDGREAMGWLDRMLARGGELGVGPLLGRAAQAFGASACHDDRVGAGAWRWPAADVALLDVPSFDSRRPWVLDPEMAGRARIDVVADADRRELMRTAAPQLAGVRRPLRLPGGIVVDGVVRRLVRDATEPPPQPWSQAPAFRRWLEERYWPALHRSRPDLVAAFPEPVVRSAAPFQAWCRSAFAHDDVPFLLAAGRAAPTRLTVSTPRRDDGLNLVGYLTRESSLGDVARRLLTGLHQAAVPVSTIAYNRTASPVLAGAPAPDQTIVYDTSLAIVTADQFPMLAGDHPELFDATTRMIGYWFWELEHIPEGMRSAMSLVDEIWAGSRFVADAFGAVSRIPVRHVPIPIPEPQPSDRMRSSFPPLAGQDGRFVFLTAFDHLSVTERKNPLGSIEAFSRAFAPNEGPLLVIKTMNGRVRWPQHQRVVAAAAERPDVVVWDEPLSRPDQMALVRAVDCLVSLHRSEGLGLHLAEAMWLCTPTIATRYSGNVDFMDDRCSLLVGHRPVRVQGGQGVYPPSATWADPDLDEAAAAMRALAGDPELHGRLSVAGRARMNAQPSLRDTGARVAALLGEGRRD